jgi:glycosyltransferase involved in cell wall biosynthesis
MAKGVSQLNANQPSTIRPTLSVVAPVFNEAATVPVFYERVVAVMESIGRDFEIVLVDDGSDDNSLQVMLGLRERDPRVRLIALSRNFGHQSAITAGMDHAAGSAVIVIDSDLQDPPEVIREFVQKWDEGFDVVYGVRSTRQGETPFKLLTAKLFYRALRSITNVDIPVDTGDFRLMSRRAVDVLKDLREHHRFMRGLAAWIGFRQCAVSYVRHERFQGVTKYPLAKMVRLAADAMASFSYLPLQLATAIGFIVAGFSLVGIISAVILRLTKREIAGQATTLVSVLFLGGLQLIFLGILGEYLGRVYDETKGRPLYIVREAHGFDAPLSDGAATHAEGHHGPGHCPSCGQALLGAAGDLTAG